MTKQLGHGLATHQITRQVIKEVDGVACLFEPLGPQQCNDQQAHWSTEDDGEGGGM